MVIFHSYASLPEGSCFGATDFQTIICDKIVNLL